MSSGQSCLDRLSYVESMCKDSYADALSIRQALDRLSPGDEDYEVLKREILFYVNQCFALEEQYRGGFHVMIHVSCANVFRTDILSGVTSAEEAAFVASHLGMSCDAAVQNSFLKQSEYTALGAGV